ncbi:MAG: RNA polymerase, sigma-24 subunit, ECF subfamily [Candidatus Collierbacteria bacterium GW2011_GWC2_43_12]|uniref:RNA polymerase, sigma-24 subunit, ECF subfamily n=1 Tax=Candidatus Collierbacteria bacterium GW2011_GWC2_43_12 TaxID=1618390 RepID=A0A0G1D7K9_9BACT|nr:MAG: RNA polymerase, sigma-24 subunit, ECF subfamily [Candidatus Collierbacteria bacterium GW2011_GWC2_43_12]KKT83435.1 MAG: RNA polymerase, sigma-24 subunit, ECF subfamily [Microgenomates group bacterium GW2011_GWC1_44_9]
MEDLSKLSDEVVVEIIRKKDKNVYSEIINRYQQKLLRYATYLLGDDQLGADAVQEGFVKAYIYLNSFDIKKKFSSWIYRIVHNEAMTLINKNKRYFPMNIEIEYDSGIDLEDELIKKELIDRAHHCLDKMPILYREPLSLFFLEEKSYEEVSDILRIPVNTVGTRISRAKIIMKKICQKNAK